MKHIGCMEPLQITALQVIFQFNCHTQMLLLGTPLDYIIAVVWSTIQIQIHRLPALTHNLQYSISQSPHFLGTNDGTLHSHSVAHLLVRFEQVLPKL